jgi:hypothetical protein
MASINYTDERYEVCAGTYEILRTWKVRNMCLPLSADNPREHTQIIQVIDNAGPQFACPGNVTVSTGPNGCCATSALPSMIISEGCSDIINLEAKVTGVDPLTNNIITFTVPGTLSNFPGNNLWTPDTLAVFGLTQCLPIGTYTIRYTAADNCSNTSSCEFLLTVEDLVPPVAVCDEWTQVALGIDGMMLLNASNLNDGSYDNCNPVHFKARRMDANPCQSNDVFRDQVKFCCSDNGDSIMVVLRVYDVAPDAGDVGLDAYEGHYNECMVSILVEDKLKPLCVSPANVTVSCENFDPSLWAYGNAVVTDNCCLDTTRVYQGQAGLTHSVNNNQFDTVCNKGTIVRTFRAFDCYGNSSQCTQRIVVNYEQDYYVRFPNDVIVTSCDGTGNFGAPTFFGEDCELLAVSYTDELFTVVTDACFQIERTWNVINWCQYNVNLGLTTVPNPTPSATANSTLNLPGPIVSPAGTPAPWAPSNVRINPTDAQPTNYSTYWSQNSNGYSYKQIIKVIDTQDPVITGCQDSVYCDVSQNDSQLWNDPFWWDATHSLHDLCEGTPDLSIRVSDACSNAGLVISYLLYLDTDGDGVMETVVNSINPPAVGTINVGNASNPNFTGGTAVAFDQRNVTLANKYRFAIQTVADSTGITARVRFNTTASPLSFVAAELPYGQHKIKWIAQDGCGNETVCEEQFSIKDCKAPTVVCLNGLSSNVGPTGVCPTLWVTDFLQYTIDNCTPAAQLEVSIRRSGTGTGFPLDANGQPVTNLTFNCDDLGTQFVEVWSRDKAGNADYCETYIIIQDNAGVCTGTNATIAGTLKTEEVEGVEEANVELDGQANGAPLFGEVFSDVQGAYAFSNALPIGSDYTVTPTLDEDPLNGVTTYDLVLISRHILGLEPLGSPYKMIAADANKSNTITSFDIIELRKLILGIYTELPNNESWRFVDKTQVFTQQNNPFLDVIREDITVGQIQSSSWADDFVGIKIGDVNLTAQANGLMAADDRSAGTLLFDVDEQVVKSGEELTVQFKAADPVLGYQFTLNLTGLEVIEVLPGAGMSSENFGVFAQTNALTTSADGVRGEFAVRFRATQSGQLSRMLGVSSRITRAVAYSATAENLDIALRFHNGGVPTVSGVGFELYQNVPNPFVNRTVIGFHLPQASEATLKVYDQRGRLLHTQTGEFAKGYNAFTLTRAMVDQSSGLYYTVETPTDKGTKPMIQVR